MLSGRYIKLHQALGFGPMWLKRGAKIIPVAQQQTQPEQTIQFAPQNPGKQPVLQTQQPTQTIISQSQTPHAGIQPVKIHSLSLADLKQQTTECTACPLHQARRQAIFGQGNPYAKLLIITEAPNQADDMAGTLFQDSAEKLLHNMLKAISVQPEETYITTWVKCFPSITLIATPEEKKACQNYLNAQLLTIKPQAILGLGSNLRELATIENGQLFYQNIPMIVTYHPERLLRNPLEKKQAYQDLLLLRQLLQKD